MDLKDKIVGLALAALIALVGWNLKETWNMKEQVFKLQQGQEVLSKQIKKNTNFVKKNSNIIQDAIKQRTIIIMIKAPGRISILLDFVL